MSFLKIQMSGLKQNVHAWLLALCIGLPFISTISLASTLKASLAIIPTHSELLKGKPRGGFVEIVKLIDAHYPDGKIKIDLYPFARSIQNVSMQQADFHLPLIRPKINNLDDFDFVYVEEPIAQVTFVLYTLKSSPAISLENIEGFNIDTQRGHGPLFDFPTSEVNNIEIGIKKLLKGRSDGFVFEQEAVDNYLKSKNLSSIRRQFFASYDSAIIVPKTPQGAETAALLNEIIRELKSSGKLQRISDSIHRPYVQW